MLKSSHHCLLNGQIWSYLKVYITTVIKAKSVVFTSNCDLSYKVITTISYPSNSYLHAKSMLVQLLVDNTSNPDTLSGVCISNLNLLLFQLNEGINNWLSSFQKDFIWRLWLKLFWIFNFMFEFVFEMEQTSLFYWCRHEKNR